MKRMTKFDRGNKSKKVKNWTMAKEDKTFYEWCRNIARARFNKKLDKEYSPQRIQRKLLKHNLIKKIEDDLRIAEFIKDEDGQLEQYSTIFSIFRFVIVIFLAVIFFGGLIYVTGLLNTTFYDVGIQNEGNSLGVNFTQASLDTFGQMNSSIQALRLVAITMIFAEILLIFILNSFRKVHPSMFIVWVFIVFLAVMLSAPISNSYESLLQQGIYEGLLESFTGANWLLLNLPLITLMVGILGGIFMFINIIRGGGEQNL